MSALIAPRKPVSAYRPPLRTRDLPLPPRWTPREKAIAQARLTQFVMLSMLLHALAILLFGAPGGASRDGRAMWGSLEVVIREAYRAAPATPSISPAPMAPTPKVQTPQPAPRPQADPQPQNLQPPLAEPQPVTPAPESRPAPLTPAEFPPLLDRLAPSAVKIEPAVDFKVPPPIQTPKIPEPLLQPLPTLPERSTLPQVERVPAVRIPVETPKIPTPLLQPMPSLPERSTLPPVEAPVIRVPVETPRIPAPMLQPLSPMPDRATLPQLERVPVEAPPVPRAPPADIAPRVPSTEMPRAPAETTRVPAETRTPPTDTPRTTPESSRPTPTDTPRATPAETPPASTPSFRTPAPTAREPDRDYDPTKPSLDLDAMRRRAGDLTRQGTGNRAVLPFPMPPVAKPKSKLEEAIENARKPDCRDAYKALGLAAVVPLLANEFGEGTCRW